MIHQVTFRTRDIKDVPFSNNACSDDSFCENSIKADLFHVKWLVFLIKLKITIEFGTADPFGCLVVASVTIVTFNTSPYLLK